MKHTPGPWSFNPKYKSVIDQTNTVLQVSGFSIPCGYVPDEHIGYANAKFIVRACNAHYDLLAACKQALASAVPHPVEHPTMTAAWAVLREAIAKAEGEPAEDTWNCPNCGEPGGTPRTIYSREYQGESPHGGMVEWEDEGCSLCVKGRGE